MKNFFTRSMAPVTSRHLLRTAFTLKTHQKFSVHSTPEKLENATITGHVGFVSEESHIIATSSFSKKFRFQNVFRQH